MVAKSDWKAEFSKRRARCEGDAESLRKRLWLWLDVCHDMVKDGVASGDLDLAVRAMHCGNQLASSYLRSVEGSDYAQG